MAASPLVVANPRTGRAYSPRESPTTTGAAPLAPTDVVATYAQRIKDKTGTNRKSPSRPAATAVPTTAPPAETGELQRLKDELRRINQELSKLGRVTRPDAARQTHIPEKQELLRRKVVLESQIRALPKP